MVEQFRGHKRQWRKKYVMTSTPFRGYYNTLKTSPKRNDNRYRKIRGRILRKTDSKHIKVTAFLTKYLQYLILKMNEPLYKLGDFNAIQVMRFDQTASGYGTLAPRGRGINGGWSTSLVRVRRSARPLLGKSKRLDGSILQPKGRSTGGPRRLRMDEGSITWSL